MVHSRISHRDVFKSEGEVTSAKALQSPVTRTASRKGAVSSRFLCCFGPGAARQVNEFLSEKGWRQIAQLAGSELPQRGGAEFGRPFDSPRTSMALAALPEMSRLVVREIIPTAQVQDCDSILIIKSERMNGLLEKHPGPGGQPTNNYKYI